MEHIAMFINAVLISTATLVNLCVTSGHFRAVTAELDSFDQSDMACRA